MVWVVFWMAVGGIAFVTGKQKSISLTTGPSFVALASSLALMVVIIAGVSLGFVGSQKYYAEVVYTKGAAAAALGNTQEAIEKVQSAAAINGSVDIYWRSLAQLYLNQANAIAEDAKTEQTQRQQQTGVAVNNAIQAAQLATEVAPSNVANWNVRGFIYRSLIGVPGAENLAIEWYEKAKQLEPGSPFSWTELGRVKILAAQAGSDGTVGAAGGLQGAIADLEQAIELKPDYAPAHYLLAVAYDQLGNQAEAIAKLEQTKQVAPQDVGLAFQLGVIYYRQAELGKARDEFERAKSLNVSYANARYMLGLVYDRLGRRQDAIAEFAAVAALNPDNQEVRTILSNLAAGRAALEGIGQPSNPPIDDIPPELTEEE